MVELRGIINWIICLSHKNYDEDVVRNSVGEIIINKSKLMALSADSKDFLQFDINYRQEFELKIGFLPKEDSLYLCTEKRRLTYKILPEDKKITVLMEEKTESGWNDIDKTGGLRNDINAVFEVLIGEDKDIN